MALSSTKTTAATPSAEQKQETTSTFTFNKQACLDHLNKIAENFSQYIGKKGYNPFLWGKQNLTPLFNRLNGLNEKGEKTKPEEISKELHDAVFAIPLDVEPKVTNYEEPPKQDTGPKLVQTPAGLQTVEDATASFKKQFLPPQNGAK